MRRALVLVIALAAWGCFSGYQADDRSPREMRVHRGRFVRELTLTGEVEAARGEMIAVPNLPSWNTSIKWIADDGTQVHRGDRVVELDNTQFTSGLDAKRQAVAQAEEELQQKDAEGEADLLQKKLDVDSKQADYEKTKLDAAVPKDVISARDYEDRQIKFKRATVELAKARSLLRSQLTAAKSDRANLVLNLEKAKRELQTADDAINALILRAPRDGIVVLKDHPWEGRKIKEGDGVWIGFPLAMIPDPDSLRINASLPDVDDRKIAAGMPATVILDAYPSIVFPGVVGTISAVAQENTTNRQSLRRAFRVAIKLGKLDPVRMRPGLSARVIIRRQAIDDALLIPRAALDSAAKKKDVRIGDCNEFDCVVLGGLKEGESL
jgi:multidrug resistance efflux pump